MLEMNRFNSENTSKMCKQTQFLFVNIDLN